MTMLALDTATREASVAICRGDAILVEAQRSVSTHSERLLHLIDQALTEAGIELADLDAIVCGRGPGSFTGLRIGLATAKGLCWAAGKPLICIGSMVALASAVQSVARSDDLIVTMLDGRRGEVFCATFRGGIALQPELVCQPQDVPRLIAPPGKVLLVGDGALRYRELLLELIPQAEMADDRHHAIRASYLARAALPALNAGTFDDLASVTPLYLRPPDIRPSKQPDVSHSSQLSLGASERKDAI